MFEVLYFKWSAKKNCVAKFDELHGGHFHMKIIKTTRPINLVTVRFSHFFIVSCWKPKTWITYSECWWFGEKKYFCFFITANRTLQRHAEFSSGLKRTFLTFYFCSFYSLMLLRLLRWDHDEKTLFHLEVPNFECVQKKQMT